MHVCRKSIHGPVLSELKERVSDCFCSKQYDHLLKHHYPDDLHTCRHIQAGKDAYTRTVTYCIYTQYIWAIGLVTHTNTQTHMQSPECLLAKWSILISLCQWHSQRYWRTLRTHTESKRHKTQFSAWKTLQEGTKYKKSFEQCHSSGYYC